jgi:hypothetical protein
MESERRGAEVIRTPLSRRPCGIETFRVEGAINDEPVHARWDGRWMTATMLLCEHLGVAMAVDAVFAEAGFASVGDDAFRGSAPEDLLLAIVECCDIIDLAEFEVRGRRHVISADD